MTFNYGLNTGLGFGLNNYGLNNFNGYQTASVDYSKLNNSLLSFGIITQLPLAAEFPLVLPASVLLVAALLLVLLAAVVPALLFLQLF